MEDIFLDRRQTRRFDGEFHVVSRDAQGLNFGVLRDLSRMGAFVETEKLMDIGTPFSFILSNGQRQAVFDSTVVRRIDNKGKNKPSGLGLHFAPLTPLARTLRDDLLMLMMSQKHHKMWDVSWPNRLPELQPTQA